MPSLKKSVLTLSLLTVGLLAADLTEAQIAEKKAKLEVAKEQAAEAKIELKAAKEKLAAAEKIMKEKELALPPGEGGAVIYSSHVELGYVETSGNTDTKSGSFDGMAKAEWGKNVLKLDLDYIYGEEDSIENNNKLIVELNYDYHFAKKFAFNYLVGYKDDKFSGFEYQLYTGPGVKYGAIRSDEHILDFQTNILYSQDVEMDKFFNDVALSDETKYPYDPVKGAFKDPDSGKTETYTSFYIKGDYAWKITDTSKFTQVLSYRVDTGDMDVYFINSKTGFESKINSTFSMGVNYKVDYVNRPPEGNENTDKTLTVALILDF
jgi:putative salt-induced outer membrane protein